MADKTKYKNLEEADKGYNELYGKYQKGQEEGNLTKKELEGARVELQKLKGGIEERGRKEEELKRRLRQSGLNPEQRKRINEQFLEQMRQDPVATVDSRIVQIIKGQGYVKKEDLDKQSDRDRTEEDNYNRFVSSHNDFEKVRSTFTKLWNELPANKKDTSSLELIYKAAKGEMATERAKNFDKENEDMRANLIQEMREKATLSGGRKIKTKKELEADEKEVNSIVEAHRSSKVSLTR